MPATPGASPTRLRVSTDPAPVACHHELATISTMPATAMSGGRGRPQRPAVQQHRGGHAGAELREMRQQRGRQRLRPVMRVGQDGAEQAGGDDGQRQRDLAAAVRAEPQREQPGERQRRVERHLDPERPHRWVEVLDRLLEVVLREEQEDRELVGVDLRRVVEMAQQQERRADAQASSRAGSARRGGSRSGSATGRGVRRPARRRRTGGRSGSPRARRTAGRRGAARRS